MIKLQKGGIVNYLPPNYPIHENNNRDEVVIPINNINIEFFNDLCDIEKEAYETTIEECRNIIQEKMLKYIARDPYWYTKYKKGRINDK